MNIAIIAAMEEELLLIRDKMTDPKKIPIGKHVFYQGHYGQHQVIVTLSGVGKAFAAAVTGFLIGRFNINSIVMTGLAGALDPRLRIGDIVVSTLCVQHDVDARPNFPQYQLPFDKAIFHADPTLIKLGEQAASIFLTNHLCHHIKAEDLALFGIDQPRCILGGIATGDQFIVDSDQLAAIRLNIHQALQVNVGTVDMETAAIIATAQKFAVPAVALRIISDKGVNKDYQRFKHSIAGQYTAGIISCLLQQLEKRGK